MSSVGLLETPCSARLVPASPSSGSEWFPQDDYVNISGKSNPIRLASKVSLFEALEEIAIIYLTHQESNWDGYGALPISKGACIEAMRFLEMLPEAVPMPEIIPEPDGNIAIEWYKSRLDQFTVSFSGHGTVTFFGKFGQLARSQGAEYFFASIPLRTLHNIRQIILT